MPRFKYLVSYRNNSSYKYVFALSLLFCFDGKRRYSFEELLRFIIPFYFNMTRFKIVERASGKFPRVLQNIYAYSAKRYLEYLCEDDFRYLCKQNLRQFFSSPLSCFDKDQKLSEIAGRNEFFSYSLKEKYIELSPAFFDILNSRNMRDIIKDMIFLSLVEFLEKYNSMPNLYTKLSGMLYKKDLSRYKKLFLDRKSPLFCDVCHICGEKIGDRISIDHFIPFNYIAKDDLWNLVPVHVHCNTVKNDSLGTPENFEKLIERNRQLYRISESCEFFDVIQKELFDQFPDFDDLEKEMRDIYDSCMSIGYREFSFKV